MTTIYNRMTKAQLIELLEKKDDKYNNLLHRAKEIIKRKNDEIKTLKDKYENITLEKFIKDGLLLATETNTEIIHNEWYKRTGENVRFDYINDVISSLHYDITKTKRRIYDNEYSDLYKDVSNNCKINIHPEGFIYIKQLEEDVGTNIFKPGKTDDPLNRDNNYYNKYEQKVYTYELYHVSNMRLCEKYIMDTLKQNGYKPISKKCKNSDKQEKSKEFFDIDYETLHNIYLEAVRQYDGVQYDVGIVLKNHKLGRFINMQKLEE